MSVPAPKFLSIHRDDAKSYWQPVPANGYSTVMLRAEDTASGKVAMGTQTVAPDSYVREHAHPEQEELIFVLEGEGIATVEGKEMPMRPGQLIYLGPNARHTFRNTTDRPLTFAWTMVPAGLEKFFAAIGREKQPGEAAPAPFARPADIKSIEMGTVFADLSKREPA